MTTQQAIEALHALPRLGQGAPGLARMQNLMDYLGNPEKDLQCIHIAGTNGSQFFIVQAKTVTEDYLKTLEDARDNNEEEMGVTIGDEFYTLSQLYPDSVMDYYREHGGAVHLEYVYGNAYTIFGQVIEGMDVVDAIAAVDVDENSKPLEDVIINSITFEPYTAE